MPHLSLSLLWVLLMIGKRPARSFLLFQRTTSSRHAPCRVVPANRRRLFGIVEWRDDSSHDRSIGGQDNTNTPSDDCRDPGGVDGRSDGCIGSNRELLMLPFRAEQALVLGKSLSCTLKDGRFFDLFQDCIDEHSSVLGMALLGEDGILDHVILCEISDYSIDAGFRGRLTIHVTLTAVGRAALVQLTQMQPIMIALCREIRTGTTIAAATTTVAAAPPNVWHAEDGMNHLGEFQ